MRSSKRLVTPIKQYRNKLLFHTNNRSRLCTLTAIASKFVSVRGRSTLSCRHPSVHLPRSLGWEAADGSTTGYLKKGATAAQPRARCLPARHEVKGANCSVLRAAGASRPAGRGDGTPTWDGQVGERGAVDAAGQRCHPVGEPQLVLALRRSHAAAVPLLLSRRRRSLQPAWPGPARPVPPRATSPAPPSPGAAPAASLRRGAGSCETPRGTAAGVRAAAALSPVSGECWRGQTAAPAAQLGALGRANPT